MRSVKEMKPYFARLRWDIKNLFNNKINPYVAAGEGDLLPKNRTAIEDIGHATKNIWIEWKK